MKQKLVLFGVVLAAFLMVMTPVLGAVNAEETPVLSSELNELINENIDDPEESSILAFIFIWIFLWICENILHLDLSSIFNRFINP